MRIPLQDTFKLCIGSCRIQAVRSVDVSVCMFHWQAFHEEYSRLYLLSKETPTPQNDARLQHVLVYFLQNNAPKQVVERTLLEQFADKNLSYDERFVLRIPRWSFSHLEAAGAILLTFSSLLIRSRSISIMKVARAKLREIGPDEVDMEEYKVRDWNATFDPSHCQNSWCPKQHVGNRECGTEQSKHIEQ